MPRSGGDYVFQSRILGGAWATIFAFTLIALSAAIFVALAGYLGATLILAPFLTLLGAAYDVQWALDAGAWFAKPAGIFVVGCACTVWGAAVTGIGMRFYALIQRWMFILGAVCLLILIGGLLFSASGGFETNLNRLMSEEFGIQDAYQQVLTGVPDEVLTFSLGATILAAVPASFSLIYPGWSAQTGGEIKRASNIRSNAWAIVGAAVFSMVAMAIMAALLTATVGSEFLYKAGSLFFNDPDNYPLPVAPFFGFFVALVPGATFFIWVAFVMFLAWWVMWFPNIPLAGSRVLVAMSFDKVLPEWLGRINSRTHTPLNAIIAYSIPIFGLCALYAFVESFVTLTLGLSVQGMLAISVTMVAAMLFPYRKPGLYNSSLIARYRIMGVPLIVPTAATFLVFAGYCLFQYLTDEKLGINGTKGLIFVGGTYLIALVTYVTARIYRSRKEGIDLNMIYRELPVE
jgi:amino acid transporter